MKPDTETLARVLATSDSWTWAADRLGISVRTLKRWTRENSAAREQARRLVRDAIAQQRTKISDYRHALSAEDLATEHRALGYLLERPILFEKGRQ